MGKAYPNGAPLIIFLDHFSSVGSQISPIQQVKDLKILPPDNLLGSLIAHEMIVGQDRDKRNQEVVLKLTT